MSPSLCRELFMTMGIGVWRLGPSLYQRVHYSTGAACCTVLYWLSNVAARTVTCNRLLETWERPRRLFGESYVHSNSNSNYCRMNTTVSCARVLIVTTALRLYSMFRRKMFWYPGGSASASDTCIEEEGEWESHRYYKRFLRLSTLANMGIVANWGS